MAETKFEEALKKLEKVVSDLERGELSLDDSLKKYEEGVQLSRLCTKKLEEAERKVEILVKSEEGKKEKQPFEVSKAGGKEVNEGEGERQGSKDGELLF
ncbi:exodeoxyribonuclease VII small subunit [candidate division NPL-UPA2 bacterium]|nr:exodeoxyribonuclease VII small subunit [candidate division NPL-UPA2 bacterium]